MIKTQAPGKTILFGEHAVVYNITGIAAALDIYTTWTIEENDKMIVDNHKGPKEITIEKIKKIKKEIDSYLDNEEYDKITKLKEKMDPYLYCPSYVTGLISELTDLKNMKMVGRTKLRKGMGGSASAFAALLKGLSLFYNLNLSKKEMNKMAYRADCVAHAGTASGIDNSAAVYGGYVEFKKEKGPTPLNIKKELPIVIGDTKKKANTGEMVANVRKLRNKKDNVRKAIESVEDISQQALTAIKNHDLTKLGQLMNENQKLLEIMQVSTKKLDNLIKAARDAGAYGAKLSGAGGGGIMVALTENQEEVAKAIEDAGGEAIITELGVDGVKEVE